MPGIYEHRMVVAPSEIDGLGHVTNVSYLQWMVDAAVAHSASQGWPLERYEKEKIAWVVRSHQLEYLRPAFEGDNIIVRTWVATMKRVSSERRYEVVREKDGDVLAQGVTEWAFVDLKTLAPIRIPDEVLESFEVVNR